MSSGLDKTCSLGSSGSFVHSFQRVTVSKYNRNLSIENRYSLRKYAITNRCEESVVVNDIDEDFN